MFKKFFAGIAFAVIFAASVCISASALDVIIDGEKVQFNDTYGYPFIVDGTTLVPLRVTMEAYGANVSWDAEQSTAIVTFDETTVCCPTDESCIYRNGTRIPNSVGATVIDGRTYLPIRAVLEAFDAVVGYDGNVLVSRPEHMSFVKKIESGLPGDRNFWGEWSRAMSLFESGKYSEASAAFIKLLPTILAYDRPENVAMLYNHLGFCYEHLGNGNLAAACFMREGEFWDKVNGQHQTAIAAKRKAKYSHTTVQMFATTDVKKYNIRLMQSSKYIPASGIITGVTLKGSEPSYLDHFEYKTGKRLSAGLIYGTPSEGISPYIKAFRAAAENGTYLQYALQPVDLADLGSIRQNDGRYIDIARDIADVGGKVFVRFACEMNDPGSKIFTENYELYKEKFRYVADIFHTYAPNCVMVWSPNFSPEDTMELYYPGDAYVDYVGISAYAEYQPETDPLEQGVDRSRFAAILNKIVSLYGHKKPIMVSECGASYRHPITWADITDFSTRQIYEFFTYLPIKFPQVSSVFLFETKDISGVRLFDFDGSEAYKNAAMNGLMSERYLSYADSDTRAYSFELGNNVRVPATKIQLHSFVQTLFNDFAYVVYRINDVDVGVSYGIPYTVEADLTAYKGQTVKLSCLAFDSQQRLCASRSINLVVEEVVDEPEEEVPAIGAGDITGNGTVLPSVGGGTWESPKDNAGNDIYDIKDSGDMFSDNADYDTIDGTKYYFKYITLESGETYSGKLDISANGKILSKHCFINGINNVEFLSNDNGKFTIKALNPGTTMIELAYSIEQEDGSAMDWGAQAVELVCVTVASIEDENGNVVEGSTNENNGTTQQTIAETDMMTWNGHRYTVFKNETASWEEAKAYCESLGGHLVSINTAEENAFVAGLLRNGHYFIGGIDNGGWHWVTGEPASFVNWSEGEPNNLPGYGLDGQPYILMYGPTSGFVVGKWDDCWGQNGHAAGFICEWDS